MESNILEMPNRITHFLKDYHEQLLKTGGYTFLRKNLLKLGIAIIIILALFYIIDKQFGLDEAIKKVTDVLSPSGVIGVYFLNEVFLGFITPEIPIVWAKATANPYATLSLLAVLSYVAGVLAYFLGKYLSTRKIVRERILERHANTMDQLRQFGGLLIILAALTPLPYPIVCQLCGLNKYPLKHFLLITLVRFLRFGIYGAVLFSTF